jgi:hypothetical protein
MKNTLATIALALLMCCSAFAQSKPTTPARVLVAGKVFAITNGGDVKPALLARVYLYPPESLNAENVIRLLTIESEFEQKLKDCCSADPNLASEIEDHCRDSVTTIDDGIKFSIHLDGEPTVKNRQGGYSTDTDEAGAFSVRVKPGNYIIVAVGQAGSNVAIWMDKVTVIGTASLKLHSIVEACRSK